MTSLEPKVKAEAKAAAKSMLKHPERGALVYSEKRNRKARRARLMYLVGSGIAAAGFIAMAVVIALTTFLISFFPLFARVISIALAGVTLYWGIDSVRDLLRRRRTLRHLKVYDFGLRLPKGAEEDVMRWRPPRYIPFNNIEAFYPNEGKVEFPYFVVSLKGKEMQPIIIPKELIGNWGRFRRSVKDKMAVRKGWYFLEGEGPAFGGYVGSDDMHLMYGDKERPAKLSWDAIAEEPAAKMLALRNLAVLTVKLRKGGKLKFLVPLGTSDRIARNYGKYVERFWKEPEKEEERWEKLEKVVESSDGANEDKQD